MRLWKRIYRLVWRRPTAIDNVEALTAGLVGVAMATALVLPNRNTAKAIEAQTRGMNNVLRAMTGAPPAPRPTTPEPEPEPTDDVPNIHTHEWVNGDWRRTS